MNPLKKRLTRLFQADGAISVAEYMTTCLFDPEHGYYTTREPFGASGDFTTAPEISQIFGEVIASWGWAAWDTLGRPLPFNLTEIGPGRGTLMSDMLRTFAKLDAGFVNQLGVSMIEISPRLRAVQQETLRNAPRAITWRSVLGDTSAPSLIVANELFDAIPTRQFAKTRAGWRERMVTTNDTGDLQFAVGAAGIDAALLPAGADAAEDGSIIEISPAREALMDEMSSHIRSHGGIGLFIDYGYTVPPFGDTLQALRRHVYEDVLASPGEADLTTHVDFTALARVAQSHGLATKIMTQGDFLVGAGLLERAGTLGAGKDDATQERLRAEVERLAAPDAMGTLFKVLIVHATHHELPQIA